MDYLETSYPIFVSIAVILSIGYLFQSKSSLGKKYNELKSNYENKAKEDEKKIENQSASIIKINKDLESLTQNINAIKGQNSNEKIANQIEKLNTKNENIFATKVELSELQQQITPLQHQLKDATKNIESKKQQITDLVKQSEGITKKQKEFSQQLESFSQQQTQQTQSIQQIQGSLEKQIKQIVTEQIKNMKKEQHQLLQNMINESKLQTQNELKSVNERIDNQIQLNSQQQQQTEDPNLQINQEIANLKQELNQIQWQSFKTNIEFELQSFRQLQQDFNSKIQEQQNDTIELRSSINENANDQINQLVACLHTKVEDLFKQFDEYKGKQQDQFSMISQQLEVQEAKLTETKNSQTILQENIEARQNQFLENNLNIKEIKQRLHELSLSNPQLIENIDMLKQSQLQLTNQSNENLEKNLQYQEKLEQDIISLKQSLLDHKNQIQQQDTEEDQRNIQLQELMQKVDDLKLQVYQMDDGLKQNLSQIEETDLKLASLTEAIKQINPDTVAETQKEINLIKSDLLKQSNEKNINQEFETLQVQFKELNQKIQDTQHKAQAPQEVPNESNDNIAIMKEIDHNKGLLIQLSSQLNDKIEKQEFEKFLNQTQQQITDQISTFQKELEQLKLQISVQNENLQQSNLTHNQEMEQKLRQEILQNQQTQVEISNKLTTKIDKEIELLNNQFQSFQQHANDKIKESQQHQEKQIEQINIQKLAQQGDHTSEIANIKNQIVLISQTQNSIQGQLQNKLEQEEVKKLNDQIQQIQSQIKELIQFKLDHVQEFAENLKELELVKNTQLGIQSQMKESIEKQNLEAEIKKQMSDQIQNSQILLKEKDSEISKLVQDVQKLNTTLSSSIDQIQEQIVKIQGDQLSMITQLKSKVEQQEHNNQLQQISQKLTDSNQANQLVLNEQKDQLSVQKEKLEQFQSTNLSEILAVKEILDLIKQAQLELISQLSTKIGQQEFKKINNSLQQIQQQIECNQNESNKLKVEIEKLNNIKPVQQSQSPQEIQYILEEIPKITKTQQSIITQLSTKIGLQDFETQISKLQGKISDSEQVHQKQIDKLNQQIISDQKANLKSLQDFQKQSENLLQLSKEDILSQLSISKSQLSEDFLILTTNTKEVLQLFNQNQQQQSDLREIIKLLLNNNPQQTQAPNKDTNSTAYIIKINESLKRINDFIQQFQYQPQFESNEVRLKNITEIIEQIYENSWKKRHIEYKFKFFVREIESEQEMQRNYSIRKSESKAKLKKVCTSFRQARGDGNCFYTAFGYQFLQILLMEYSDQQFGDFIQEMKKICLPMKLNTEQIQISEYDSEQQLLEEFLYRLEKLRQIPDSEREEKFTQQFAAFEQVDDEIDGVFYGLSTIFFRNLANYVVEFSEMKEALFDRENLLIWEKECNSNEIVIEALAKYLKIRIQLVFFDQGGLEVKEYFQDCPNRVILLIKPGHYSIGIKDQNSKLTIESYTKKISAEILGLLNTPLKEEEVQKDEQPNQNNQIVQLFEKSLIKNQDIINSQAQIIEQFQKNLEICIKKHENLGNEIQKLNLSISTQGERIIKFETFISSIQEILQQIQNNMDDVKQQSQSKFAQLKSQLQDQYQQFMQQINKYQIIQQQIDKSNINEQSQAINQQQIQQTEQVQIHQQNVDVQQGDNISQNEQISVNQVDQQQTSDNVQHQEQNENKGQSQIQESDQHEHPQDNQNQQNSEEQQQQQEEGDIY